MASVRLGIPGVEAVTSGEDTDSEGLGVLTPVPRLGVAEGVVMAASLLLGGPPLELDGALPHADKSPPVLLSGITAM